MDRPVDYIQQPPFINGTSQYDLAQLNPINDPSYSQLIENVVDLNHCEIHQLKPASPPRKELQQLRTVSYSIYLHEDKRDKPRKVPLLLE